MDAVIAAHKLKAQLALVADNSKFAEENGLDAEFLRAGLDAGLVQTEIVKGVGGADFDGRDLRQ
jgi:hypothetical protein